MQSTHYFYRMDECHECNVSKHLALRCGWVTNRFTVGISASIVPVWSLDVAASRALCVAAGEGLGVGQL
jgi:hypothetical protein